MNSIEFLKRFHPGRPWVLTAIEPSQKGIETKAFMPGQDEEAAAWIEKWNGKRNCYFSVAEPIEPEDKKCERENVEAVHWLHVDIDAAAGDLLAELERIKSLVTTKLPNGALKPTVVIYSGGGYQAFWRLAEPVPIHGNLEAAEQIARYNRQLEVMFGGDSCHDVSRIMRLPGTMNIPNARKVAKGRVPVEAKVVTFTKSSYHLSEFTAAADVSLPSSGGEDIKISGNVARLATVDDLDRWNVPDRLKVIIVQGHDPDTPKEGDNSRSAWLFDCVCNLVRHDVPDEVIYSVITDPGFKIASSVLESSNADRYAKKQIKSAKEAVESEWLRKLNDRYAVIGNMGGKCRVVEEVFDEALERHRLVKQTFEDFRNRYMNVHEMVPNAKGELRPVPVGRWWLEHPRRRQYDRLVFAPGREVEGAYNLWRGYGCNAIPGKMHESYLEHLHRTICSGNHEHYDYLIRWLARAIQRPELPGSTAFVMRGRPGTGKSFFAKQFGYLFGRHFLHVSNAAHLVGNFNSHLRDAIVVFGDEAFYAGDKKHESVLKTLITEDTLIIEAKGVDAEASPNYTHLILASNSDWVIPVGAADRRFFIVDVDDKYERDTVHFGKIQRDLDNGGYESLLHYLLHFDLDGFDVQNVPQTDALAHQKAMSLDPHEEWWFSVLMDGRIGLSPLACQEGISNDQIFEAYMLYCADTPAHRRLTRNKLSSYVRRMCPIGWPKPMRRMIDGTVVRGCFFPAPADCRAAWDKFHRTKMHWPELALTDDGDLPF